MEWAKVESSQIDSVGYEPETETLGIRFKPTKSNHHDKPAGQTWATEYHYANVDEMQYRAVRDAESVGKALNDYIKAYPKVHPYRKIEPVEA